MLYWIVRPFAKLLFLVTYRKIYLSGAEKIPWEKPLIIVVNHPSAFLEPCLLACFLPKPLNFLVRGDIWQKSFFYDALMRGVHLVPIYRQKDGYNNLTKNYETFNYCFKALAARKNLLVLPEGTTIQEKKLRPIKKGLGRICFGAMEQFNDLDIHIVPIGANFTYAHKLRTEVMLQIGEPIKVKEFWEASKGNPARGVQLLTKAVKEGMSEQIVTIENEEDEEIIEQLFIILRNDLEDRQIPVVSKSAKRFSLEKNLANSVNTLNPVEKTDLKEAGKKYFNLLENERLQDKDVVNYRKPGIANLLFLMAGFIPFIFGKILNILPITLAQSLTRTRVKYLEFKVSVFLALAMLLWLGWYLLWFLTGAIVNHEWFWGLVIMLPFLGYFSIIYEENWKEWSGALQFARKKRSIREPLLQRRSDLSNHVSKLAEEAN